MVRSFQRRHYRRWFAGAQCDVGGGYPDRRLSDMTLRWMQDKAGALGLALDAVKVGETNYLGEATDSYAKFLGGVYAKRNARHYRIIGATKFGEEVVDDSVERRRNEDREYEPQNDGLPKLN
ncbi:MAG: phospholipase effector Tle1 domain-containing protein [Candidatus Binatia bacterium]